MLHSPNAESDSIIAERIIIILTEKLPAGATSKWISYVYSQEYEEISTQKVACILESLYADGYVTQHASTSKKPKRIFSRSSAVIPPESVEH